MKSSAGKKVVLKDGAPLFVGVMLAPTGPAFWKLLEWTKRNEVENTTTPLSFFILTHMSSPSRLTSSWDYPDSLVQGHEKRKLTPSGGPFLTVSHPSTKPGPTLLDLSDQGREAEQMTEKREREERKERRKGGGEEEPDREGTHGWKVRSEWCSGIDTIATS